MIAHNRIQSIYVPDEVFRSAEQVYHERRLSARDARLVTNLKRDRTEHTLNVLASWITVGMLGFIAGWWARGN